MEAEVRGTRFNSLKLFPQPAPTMLLLPLIIWWARSPFAISRGLLKVGISVVSIVVMVVGPSVSFAADRYHRSMGLSQVTRQDTAEQDSDGKENGFGHLREGTLVPPTAGRIVMLGRRWAFVPSDGASQKNEDDFVGSTSTFKYSSVSSGRSATQSHSRKPRPTRLGGATLERQISVRTTSTLLNEGEEEEQTIATKRVPHVLIVENLMLQRIAEAVRADASDDHWMISGEVTEYFKENRLIIRTAQRANSQ